MDVDTAVPGPAYESQPVADYRPRLASLPESSIEELRAAYVLLTGCEPLHEVACTGIGADAAACAAPVDPRSTP